MMSKVVAHSALHNIAACGCSHIPYGVDTDGSLFTERYDYDNLGRLETTVTTLKGESYSTSNHYDALGRMNGLTYPGGFTIRQRYNSHGHLEAIENAHGSVGNTTVYWEATEDDAFGNITGYRQGNGVVTTKAYHANTGLIASIAANRNSISIQNHHYVFDTEGNLSSRRDAKRSFTERFCYDSLNRLTHSNVGASCEGGKTISYDYHGNIVSRSDVKGGQAYQYGNGAGPHAVTSIGNGNAYTYNAKGEMLSGGGRSGLTYTIYGKPKHMQKGSYYTDITYGPNQNRIQRIDGGNTFVETTTYIGKLYEKVVTSQKTLERFYIGDSAIRIQETTSSNNYSERTVYLHQDHIGSVVAKTDEAGAIIESLANEPWGKQLNDSFNGAEKTQDYNPESTDRGFTGHEHLAGVGLIHMNGRVYDPEIGRFVSPDLLIQDPENSQSFNRYTYVWNNPLRYTDPTGLFACSRNARCSTILGSGVSLELDYVNEAGNRVTQAVGSVDEAVDILSGLGKDAFKLTVGDRVFDLKITTPTVQDQLTPKGDAHNQTNYVEQIQDNRAEMLTTGDLGSSDGQNGQAIRQEEQVASDVQEKQSGNFPLPDSQPIEQVDIIAGNIVGGGVKAAVIGFTILKQAAKSIFVKGSSKIVGKEGVQGFTKHGLNQVINRGFKPENISQIIKNGKSIQAQGRFGSQTRFTLGENTVVVNSKGKIITVFSTAKDGRFIPTN